MKLFDQQNPDPDTHEYDLREVQELAAAGRRLAIYDRATGLYAFWYLQLRGSEEVSRARRHGKGVHCLSIWAPAAGDVDLMRDRLKDGLRDHDLSAYLNNGHFVALLTETDRDGAQIVAWRLLHRAPAEVSVGIASFPDDGATFEDLLESAKRQAGVAEAGEGVA